MQGRVPTRIEKKIISEFGCNPKDYLVTKHSTDKLEIKSRDTGAVKTIKLKEM